MDDNRLEVRLTMDELKVIFKALGKLPFEEVYELIGELNDQVNSIDQKTKSDWNSLNS